MNLFGDNLKKARKEKNLTLENLAEKYNERFDAGLSKGTLSKYENGKQEPMITVVNNLATILGVSTDYLLGNSLPEGAFEYNPTHKIPILGYISAGLPLYAEQHIEGYTYTELNGGAEYFGLIVKGDSMNAAMIYPGATLIVRRQESVENGEIAVVMVNDENATVKQFRRENDMVILEPKSTNPIHQTQIYSLKNTKIRIIGKVVEVKYAISIEERLNLWKSYFHYL